MSPSIRSKPACSAATSSRSSLRMSSQLTSPWRSSTVASLVYVVAFLVLATVLTRWFGFPLDDSWIHEVVARNLVEYRTLGFTPGILSSGSTSLLWTIILAARSLLFPGLSAVVYCAGLSVLLLAGIGLLLKRLTEQDGLRGSASWCLALAPAASGNFLWFGLIGMEHLLFILLSLCVVEAWFAVARRTAGWLLLLPSLCFLLVITRPEGICLLALLFVSRKAAARPMRDWMRAAAGALGGAILSAAVNWMTGHHLTPLTMEGRRHVLPGITWLSLRLHFLGHTAARLISVWSIDAPQHIMHGLGLVLGLPVFALLFALIVLAIRQLRADHASRLLLLCAWAGVIELLYFAMLPSPGHGGRYIALPVMVFLPLIFFGLHTWLRATGLHDRGAWAIVFALLAVTGTTSIAQWHSAAAADIEQINTEHGAMAGWIEQHLPASSIAARQVAVFDIGRIGYQVHGNLIDLGGLVDHDFRDYLVHDRTATYLQERGVRYVVLAERRDPSTSGASHTLALDDAHGARLTLLHTICADTAVARLAFTSSETAMQCQRLYAIHYVVPGLPGPSGYVSALDLRHPAVNE